MIKKYNSVIFMILVALVAVVYAGILYNQTMPFAEGWYTYYAQLINKGQMPYKDFEYLFSPFYIYFISFITSIFGYKIIVLRGLGVIVYCIIGIILYLILREYFDNWIAATSAIVGILYLQSEVVQIFYDYIRFMDIFACLTILFLIRFVKRLNDNSNSTYRYALAAGVSNSLFILIKQNMGLIFMAFAIILICYLSIYYRLNKKKIMIMLAYYMGGIFTPLIICIFFMLLNGSLSYFIKATGGNALAAKGGIIAVLFGWIINNKSVFISQFSFAALILIALLVLLILDCKHKFESNVKLNNIMAIIFCLLTSFSFIIFAKKENIAIYLKKDDYYSPYAVFLVIFSVFVLLGILLLLDWIKKQQKVEKYVGIFCLAGAYFAISYGCGTSGGLAEGQASIGVALIVCMLLNYTKFKYGIVLRMIVLVLCFSATIQCGIKKMDSTYKWWGMDESSLWDSNNNIEGIDILEGIKVSRETKEVYESIYTAITENTAEDDTIYCFPQIPIFYSLTDRLDPGVFAKVEWFDVSSDTTLLKDMDIIQQNKPKAILIYNSSEYAYSSHERLFRNGEISGTRRMREFLYNYVFENDYTFYGNFTANKNTLSLWIKDNDETKTYELFSGGTGTKEDPYIIDSQQELILFSKQVNNGRSFEGMYIKQTKDIDLQGETWIPIGEYDSKKYFYGIYDGNGHVIKNLQIDQSEDNVGLFGRLGGIVCNLGIEGGNISGKNSGVIASRSVGSNAMIINCYTNVSINGKRVGSIADNFNGKVINVYSVGHTNGDIYANALSNSAQNDKLDNVFILDSSISSGTSGGLFSNSKVSISRDSFLINEMCELLNNKVDDINKIIDAYQKNGKLASQYEEWMKKITLKKWANVDEAYPRFLY